jgi:hypothetical protein
MAKTWWKEGSWNSICDLCGRKYKAEELIRNWRGQMVCQEDYEPRNEQELIRPIKDQNKLPWTKPRGTLINIDVCTLEGQAGISDYGIADCCVCEFPLAGLSVYCTATSKLPQADYGAADCATLL